MKYFMTQWYIFHEISENDLPTLREELLAIGTQHDMNGLTLVASEGCNGTVAGSEEAISAIELTLQTKLGVTNFQHWESEKKPFKRFKVDIRKEIVALKHEGIRPTGSAKHLSPKEWHEMVQQEGAVVLDTRNWYETAIGKFKDAVVPPLTSFQEFPEYVQKSGIPKKAPVLMYCTSGIRCEKASEEMLHQGFENVYQLDGGITNYIKEYPEGAWEGECFVFDHRTAVDSKLQPSKRYSLCPSCGNPGDVQTACSACTKPCKLCALCLSKNVAFCSKACRKNPKKSTLNKNQ